MLKAPVLSQSETEPRDVVTAENEILSDNFPDSGMEFCP